MVLESQILSPYGSQKIVLGSVVSSIEFTTPGITDTILYYELFCKQNYSLHFQVLSCTYQGLAENNYDVVE